MEQQGQRNTYEWKQKVYGEKMRIFRWVWVGCKGREVEHIVDENEGGDDEGLSHFNAVYSGENVN